VARNFRGAHCRTAYLFRSASFPVLMDRFEQAMKRRKFISLLGGVAAWPVAAQAQQPAMPVIGFLSGASSWEFAHVADAFRLSLADTGFVEGRNVLIEYRWAEGHYDRVPKLVDDLIRRGVAVIVATGGVSSVLAAKAATTSIPIVFANGSDPVKFGVVERINRPGGNVTGATFFNNALGPKRLQVLRDVAPKAAVIGLLVNPINPNTEFDFHEIDIAARSLGIRILRVNAGSEREFDRAFATMAEQGVGALVVNADAFFYARRDQLIELATRLAVPAIYEQREFATGGGLMSYGASIAEAYRKAGIYTGRILRGEAPGDLPIQQATRFELVINLKTAKALGLEVPPTLLALADEVIE
jgi:putative ABC transport system substrate-binding protein